MYDRLQAYLIERGMTIDQAKVAAKIAMQDYLRSAIQDDKAYLNLTAPTTSERNAQIVKLTRQNIRIMKLLLNDLTAAE